MNDGSSAARPGPSGAALVSLIEALLYLAGALAAGGRSSEALPFFERALVAGPHSSMALNGLALTRLALGDRTGAAAAFRESLKVDPKQPDVARTLKDITGS